MPFPLTRKTAVLCSLTMLTTAGLFFNHLLYLRAAHAQSANGNGVCQDTWLNDIIPAQKANVGNMDGFGKSINGFGVQGECNPRLYHGGSWRSQTELNGYVNDYLRGRRVGVCRDALLTDVVTQVWRRAPRGFGESQDCNMYLYGGGSWSSRQDLINKVQSQKNDFATANLDFGSSGCGLVRANNTGKVIQPLTIALLVQGNNVVSQGGGNVVAQGGGNVVSQGGGNVVSQGGGNVIAQGGGNVVSQGGGNYHTLATGSGIPAKLVRAGTVSVMIPLNK